MEFFERTMPASSSMKPTCIMSTRPAATNTQTISMLDLAAMSAALLASTADTRA
jgi:hypothetical protein